MRPSSLDEGAPFYIQIIGELLSIKRDFENAASLFERRKTQIRKYAGADRSGRCEKAASG